MHWQYTPYTSLLIIASVAALCLAGFMWQRRKAAGAVLFMLLMLALSEWIIGYALELSSVDLAAKLFWGKMQYLGIVAVPAIWLIFSFQYTQRKQWLTRRNLILLSVEPVLMIALLWTNDLHGQIWSSIKLVTDGPFTMLEVSHGILFWVHTIYSYLLLLSGTYLLFRGLQRSTAIYRSQVIVLLIGSIAPWLANVLTITGLSPAPILDLTPFAFTLTGLTTAWALFHYQLLDLAPVARDIVIESMSDALIVIDAQRRVVDLNPAAYVVIGRPTAKIIGNPIEQILVARNDLIELYKDVVKTRTEIVLGEGLAGRPFDLRISPIYDKQARLVGRVIMLSDISERKKAESALQNANIILEQRTHQLEVASAQAEEANRLKSEFLSTVSHEIRTPFNAIMGFTNLLLTERIGPLNATQRNFLERMAGNNQRLLALVNDILDLSRIEAGRMEIESEPYFPREMLEQIALQTSSLFSNKGLNFEVTLEPSLPKKVVGDSHHVQQIIVNLLSNASKFTSQGKVELKAFSPDNVNWEVSVQDTGRGIAPHQQELVFESFRQVDGSTTREIAGSGLGLSIVRQLCQLMNGKVRVESELGKGSIFTVTLPIGAVEDVPALEGVQV